MQRKLRHRRHLSEWRFRRSFVRRIRRLLSRIKARMVYGGFAIERRQGPKAGACREEGIRKESPRCTRWQVDERRGPHDAYFPFN